MTEAIFLAALAGLAGVLFAASVIALWGWISGE